MGRVLGWRVSWVEPGRPQGSPLRLPEASPLEGMPCPGRVVKCTVIPAKAGILTTAGRGSRLRGNDEKGRPDAPAINLTIPPRSLLEIGSRGVGFQSDRGRGLSLKAGLPEKEGGSGYFGFVALGAPNIRQKKVVPAIVRHGFESGDRWILFKNVVGFD